MPTTAIPANQSWRLHERKPSGFRWLLLCVFIVGYAATFWRYQSTAIDYALLTGLAVIACCLLLRRMNKPLQITLPFWVILVVFLLAYYIKFYWITLFPEVGIDYSVKSVFFFSTDALASAYSTTTFAFCAFCVAAWFVLGISPSNQSSVVILKNAYQGIASTQAYGFVSSAALVFSLFLTIATTIIMYVGGFSVMGVESVSSPFHLAGIVFYTRAVFVPALILLLLWSSQQARKRKRFIFGLAILFLFGLSDMVLRSSRGSLVTLLASVGLLLLASGYRVEKRHLFFLAGSLIMALPFLPIVTEYRDLRIHYPSSDILSLLKTAQYYAVGGGILDLWRSLGKGIEFFVFRLTGVEMLIVFHGLNVQPLGWYGIDILTSPRGLAGFVTVDLFGNYPSDITTVAPSLVGWFYLLGGNSFTILGVAAFTGATHFLWRLLKQLRLASLPIAQTLLLSLILTLCIDGVLESIARLSVLVWPASIAICEWLVRRADSKK